MRRLLSHLRDAYRSQGPRLLLVAARWLVRPEYLLIVRELGPGIRTYGDHEGAHWALLLEGDLPALLAMSPFLTEAEIRRLWAEGQECQTCWIDGAPVFYRWDTCRPAYLSYLDRTFLPRPGDQLVSQVFTHPDFRSRGLLSVSPAHVVPRTKEQGAEREVALVAWWNAPTLHVARVKYDYGVVGTVGYWRLGPWRRYFSAGGVRLVGRTGIRIEEPPGG